MDYVYTIGKNGAYVRTYDDNELYDRVKKVPKKISKSELNEIIDKSVDEILKKRILNEYQKNSCITYPSYSHLYNGTIELSTLTDKIVFMGDTNLISDVIDKNIKRVRVDSFKHINYFLDKNLVKNYGIFLYKTTNKFDSVGATYYLNGDMVSPSHALFYTNNESMSKEEIDKLFKTIEIFVDNRGLFNSIEIGRENFFNDKETLVAYSRGGSLKINDIDMCPLVVEKVKSLMKR